MRNHLVAEIYELAKSTPNLYLMTGDLGFGVLDNFKKDFPEQFINAGISEQNMASVAAGIALEGNVVYMYSIGNFPGMRCLEQIRNDICYHNANVKIIVVGGGFAYGQLGMSHHATEDLAVMRSLPNMRVYSPADSMDAVKIVRHVNSVKGPCYIRLGKGREPDIHPDIMKYDVEKILSLYEGEEIAIIATGSIIGEAQKAVELLQQENISTGLYSVMSLKPFDKESIQRLSKKYRIIITLEEHNIIGGLGGAVAETLAEISGSHASLVRLGLQDVYTSIVGSQDFLRDYYGISARHIINRVKELL